MVYTIAHSKHVSQKHSHGNGEDKTRSAGVFSNTRRGVSHECGVSGKGTCSAKELLFSRLTKSQFEGRNVPYLETASYVMHIHLDLAWHPSQSMHKAHRTNLRTQFSMVFEHSNTKLIT